MSTSLPCRLLCSPPCPSSPPLPTRCSPRPALQNCGTVNRVTILSDKMGNPKGFAYIEFLEVDAVPNAVQLGDSELRGRKITVAPKRTNMPGAGVGAEAGAAEGSGSSRAACFTYFGYSRRFAAESRDGLASAVFTASTKHVSFTVYNAHRSPDAAR